MNKIILKYFISILLMASQLLCAREQDTLRKAGLRVGYDLSNLAISFLDDKLIAQEIEVDLALTRRMFLAFEAGLVNARFANKMLAYEYKSFGQFYRLGINYDMFNQGNSIIYSGARFAFSNMSHEVPRYQVVSEYWGNDHGFVDKTNLWASWIGVTGGIKVELAWNIYMGYAIQFNYLLSNFEDTMPPYYIPGFGKVMNKLSFGFNYSISYLIPFRKL